MNFTMVLQLLLCRVFRKHSPKSNIWNTIVKLFLKHPALPVEVTLNRKYPR
jgi:hypothetical protein